MVWQHYFLAEITLYGSTIAVRLIGQLFGTLQILIEKRKNQCLLSGTSARNGFHVPGTMYGTVWYYSVPGIHYFKSKFYKVHL